MASFITGSDAAGISSTTAVTGLMDTTGADAIVVLIDDDTNLVSVTDSEGNTYVEKTGSPSSFAVWVAANPTNATNLVVTITYSTSDNWISDKVFVCSGVNTGGNVVTYEVIRTINTSSSGTVSHSISVDSTQDLIISDCFASGLSSTIDAFGSGQTDQEANYGRPIGVSGNTALTSETGVTTSDIQSFDFSSAQGGSTLSSWTIEGGADTTKPTFDSSEVNETDGRNKLVILASESLDGTSIPASSDFNIDSPVGISTTGTVTISGNKITVTLDGNINIGDSIQWDYTKGANPIQDLAANEADSVTNQTATNNLAKPTFSNFRVEDGTKNKIFATANEDLDATSVPATSAFNIDSPTRTVTGVALTGTGNRQLEITVNADFAFGDTIQFDYTKPGTNPLRDSVELEADSWSNQAVTNEISDPNTCIELIDSGSGTGGSSASVTIDATDAELIIVAAAGYGNSFGGNTGGVTGVSDNQGNSYTLVEDVDLGDSNLRLYICTSPASAASTIITASIGGFFSQAGRIIAASYFALDSVTPYYGDVSASASSVSVSPTNAYDTIWSAGFSTNGVLGALGADQVQQDTVGSGSYYLTSSVEVDAGVGADTQSFADAEAIVSVVLQGGSNCGGGGATLTVNDATHNHTADNVDVVPSEFTLAVNDSTHGHTADNVVFPASSIQAVKIEKLDVNISGTSGTINLVETLPDVDKAFVRIVSSSDHASGGPTGSTANEAPNSLGVRVRIASTTTLSYNKQTTEEVKIMLEVWRYEGEAGGNYEFISRGRGTVSITGTSATSTALTGITDTDACIPFYNGFTTAETSNSNWEYAALAMHLNASDQVSVEKNNTGTSVVAEYDVIEFVGSAWSVGHARSASHDASNETVTMNTASTGTGGSTFDVSDWETAMIIDGTFGGDTTETGLADVIGLIYPAGTTTQVIFSVTDGDGNARNDAVAYAHILKCADFVMKRANGAVLEGNGTYGTPLSMPTGVDAGADLDQLSLEWFVSTTGTGTAHARGRLTAKIADNSGYEIQHWVHRSGNNVIARYGVLDVSALTYTPGGGGGITLTVNDATHAHTADGVVLEQGYNLTVQDATHGHTADNVVLQQAYDLTVQDATHSHTADNTVLQQGYVATVQDAAHDHTADSVALEQSNVLSVQSATHNHSADNIALTQASSLTANDATHSHTADNVTLTEAETLTVQDSVHSHIADSTSFQQANSLVVQDATHAHASENVTLAQSISITVEDTVHGHSVDAVVLTQSNQLSAQDATHGHTADSVNLGAAFDLTVNDSTHNHTADNVTLSIEYSLTVDDSTHAHTSDNVNLSQAIDLVVDNTTHTHTADGVTLTEAEVLTVQDATHSHVVDGVALTEAALLTVSNATHSHSTEEVALSQANTLTVQSATHGHTTEEVVLTQANQLAANDATHSHTADAVVLSSEGQLSVDDSTHAHTAEEVTLTQSNTLAVADAAHSHTAGNVTLTEAESLTVQSATHNHAADNIALTQAVTLSVADATHVHTVDGVLLLQGNFLPSNDGVHAHNADAVVLEVAYELAVADAFHNHAADNTVLVPAALFSINGSTFSAANIALINGSTISQIDIINNT